MLAISKLKKIEQIIILSRGTFDLELITIMARRHVSLPYFTCYGVAAHAKRVVIAVDLLSVQALHTSLAHRLLLRETLAVLFVYFKHFFFALSCLLNFWLDGCYVVTSYFG